MFALLPQPLDQIPHRPSKQKSSPSHKAAEEKPLKTHLQTQPAKQRDQPETTDRTVAGPLPLPNGPLQTGRSSRRCSTCRAGWVAGRAAWEGRECSQGPWMLRNMFYNKSTLFQQKEQHITSS